jgi:hypothetical protein
VQLARLHLIVLVLFIVARIRVLCIISKGCRIRKLFLTNRVIGSIKKTTVAAASGAEYAAATI